MNYYNENDPKAAAWLRELIREGLISDGVVDERSITDVLPTDLHGYNQCHFFAGIGGWSYALRLAGVPDDEPIWTGSCPCQPFSVAGKGKGTADERHLWPIFARLIAECRPTTVFGEQVASKDGREWLTRVFADLETMGNVVAGADLCAAGVKAPHLRQRLWWVANSKRTTWRRTELWSHKRADDRMAHWAKHERFSCTDYKYRRCKPGTPLLADGIPGIVGRVRGYGNAIVPQVAAEFISAFYEAMHDVRSHVLMSDPLF